MDRSEQVSIEAVPQHTCHLDRGLFDSAQTAQPARSQTMDGVGKIEVFQPLAGHGSGDPPIHHLDIALVAQ